MNKKWHHYLLENYPLLWNTRLPFSLVLMILVHLLHFLAGFLAFTRIEDMRWNKPEDQFFSSFFVLFSVIGSFVIFILWLLRYARNNALKHYYPYSRGKLFGEWIILFGLCLLNITYYYSFTAGFVVHARMRTDYHQALADKQILIRVAPFVQQERGVYELERRCYPAPYPVSRRYRNSSTGSNDQGTQDTAYDYQGSDDKTYTRAAIEQQTGGAKYSYLNYCHYESYHSKPYTAEEEITKDNQDGQDMLLRQDSAGIRASLTAFLEMCRRHEVRYRVDAAEWFRWIYHPPYYPVRYTLLYISGSDDAQDILDRNVGSEYNPLGYYIELERLQYIIDNTLKVYHYSISAEQCCVFIYIALGFAVLVFSFRISSSRIWLISLLAFCLLALVVGALTALLSALLGTNVEGSILLYALLILSFLVVAMVSNRKTVAGVALNWHLWLAPALLPLLLMAWKIMDKTNDTDHPGGFMDWLEDHYIAFLMINLLVYAVLIYVLTPLFRKWQAMPEN